ncbi:unnamed protein product [Meganyctiphanes norvegica]|uniref:Uncharacterized protein n=1 Tax=Meganyctiphanes norvegica TaxID=48144 RepID=A0AAV2Q403_MEGNR
MPLLNQIPKLANTVLEWVWKYLFRLVVSNNSADIQQKRHKYLCKNVDSYIRQMILNCAFKIEKSHKYHDYKLLLLEMLSDAHIVSVNLTKSGTITLAIDDVLKLYSILNSNKLTKIYHLGIDCDMPVKEKKDLPEANIQFYQILPKMNNLSWVTLTSIANLVIMRTLGAYCHHLEYLDVSKSVLIGDNAIAALLLRKSINIDDISTGDVLELSTKRTPCAQSLKVVCLSETLVENKGAILLLRFAHNLTSLGGPINAFSTSESIFSLMNLPEEEMRQLNLTELWDSKLLQDHASVVEVLCPNLNKVSVSASYTSSLDFLPTITEITLDLDFKPWADDIYSFTCYRGEHLKSLIMENNINGPIELGWLIESTPSLEHIEAHIECHYNSTDVAVWERLTTASILLNSSKCLSVFMQHSPALEDLKIKVNEDPCKVTDDWKCINDDVLVSVTCKGGLTKLKRLLLRKCAVGLLGINSLLVQCSNLSYLGYLNEWDNLTQTDIEKLRAKCKSSNWDLTLAEYDHDPKPRFASWELNPSKKDPGVSHIGQDQ